MSFKKLFNPKVTRKSIPNALNDFLIKLLPSLYGENHIGNRPGNHHYGLWTDQGRE